MWYPICIERCRFVNKTTLIQYFEWYLANDGSLWKQVAQEAKKIAALGIDKI